MVKVIKGTIIILFIISFITAAQATTLHGTIYEWSDFEKPIKNTIVEVNSTPAQYVVATTGAYSFNLSPGSYLINARYYKNNILEYTTQEELRIDREGDFVHDLLLFPPIDSEYEHLVDINLTTDMEKKNENNIYIYVILIIILLSSALLILYLIKKKKTKSLEPNEPVQIPENIPETGTRDLPSDLHDLYDMILKIGGRTTQKDLRKKIPYSEAKVSLMLDDLQNRGLIKKIKKGRSNIIIAEIQR